MDRGTFLPILRTIRRRKNKASGSIYKNNMSELRILKRTAGLVKRVVVLCVLPPREHHKEMRVRSVEPTKKGELMGGRRKEPVIESVCFLYTGSEKQFNSFLKSVIRDYLADDIPAVEMMAAKEEIKKNAEEKSA